MQAWNKLLRNIATIYTAAGVLWCFSFFNHWHFRWSTWLLEFDWFGCLYCSYDAVGIWVILFTSHGVNLLPVKEYFKKASVSCRRHAIGIVKFSFLWRTERRNVVLNCLWRWKRIKWKFVVTIPVGAFWPLIRTYTYSSFERLDSLLTSELVRYAEHAKGSPQRRGRVSQGNGTQSDLPVDPTRLFSSGNHLMDGGWLK